MVTVLIDSAIISPTKANRDNWDPGGGSMVAVEDEVLKMMAAIPDPRAKYAAVLGKLVGYAGQHMVAPDAGGDALLFVNGFATGAPLQVKGNEDSYTPALFQAASGARLQWTRVPLAAGTRIQLRLADRDEFDAPDPIGTCDLDDHDLAAAMAAPHGQMPIEVRDPNRQLLFVLITVIPESGR